jgi:hypothetical protein
VKAGVVASTLAGLCCLVAFAAGSEPAGTVAHAEAPPSEGTTSPLDNCPPDFVFQPWSGVVCVQEPETLPDGGGLSYTGLSICVEGTPEYEHRPTTDGKPTGGTGGQSAFPFLTSCNAGAAGTPSDTSDGGETPPASVGAGSGSTPETTGGTSDRRTRILIGIGGSGGAMFVTLATARMMMRRWNMTPRELLNADLSQPMAPSADSPTLPGGTVRDATTGEWIDYEYDENDEATITAEGGPDIGSDPGIEGHATERPADAPDPEPEDERFAELDEVPGQTPDQPQEFGPEFIDPEVMPEGIYVLPDPEGGLQWIASTGKVDDPFHAKVRRTNRSITGDVGVWPNRQLYLTYTYDPAGPRAQANWAPNPSTDWTAIHQRGDDRRTFLWVTRRF